eukprot:11182424-Ditylum_brightwellii.AAC.1
MDVHGKPNKCLRQGGLGKNKLHNIYNVSSKANTRSPLESLVVDYRNVDNPHEARYSKHWRNMIGETTGMK